MLCLSVFKSLIFLHTLLQVRLLIPNLLDLLFKRLRYVRMDGLMRMGRRSAGPGSVLHELDLFALIRVLILTLR